MSDGDREKFRSIPRETRDKFLNIIHDNRDKMFRYSHEERAGFVKRVFDAVAK